MKQHFEITKIKYCPNCGIELKNTGFNEFGCWSCGGKLSNRLEKLSYNFACGRCEDCRFIYQDEDDKKSESGVCSLFTDKQYFEEEKVEINNKCGDIGAIGVGEDGWAYGYFWIYKVKEFGCIKFDSKQ